MKVSNRQPCLSRRPAAPVRHLRALKVVCNANGSPDSRVRFQASRDSAGVQLRHQTPDNVKQWINGGTPQSRRPQIQVTEPSHALEMPDFVFEEAIAPIDPRNVSRTVRAVVLAGGETKNPLTRTRAMPAVPLGSSLLLVDVPINNCMSSGVKKVYVITQFQSHTLNSHIASSYPPINFGPPDDATWVDVLAAQQTVTEKEWYRGSADAIRRNIGELQDEGRGITPATDYVILSGSGIYNMDLGKVIAYHRARDADITICTHFVDETLASSKGIVRVHQSSGRVLKFEEKPSAKSLAAMRRDVEVSNSGTPGQPQYLANMGLYIFKREALFELLAPAKKSAVTHIGHHVIPNALAQGLRVHGYQYHGYWRDVSSLRDYYEANLEMAGPNSPLKQFEVEGAITAKGRQLPPALMQGEVNVTDSLLDDGAVLVGCTVSESIIGQQVYVGRGSVIDRSLILGSPCWTNESLREASIAKGERVYGVGQNCILQGCIVDENVSIGDNVQIVNSAGVQEADRADTNGYMIQDGIVVIMRNADIPAGTII